MTETQADMRISSEFLREIDPRKSYDRGPMGLPASAPATGAPVRIAPFGSPALRASRIGDESPTVSTWTSREMSDSVRDLSSMTLDELRRELKRREEAVARLQERRARIAAELAMVEAELKKCGGDAVLRGSVTGVDEGDASARSPAGARTSTPRARNTLKLADALTAAIDAGAIVGPAEAAELVRKSGYVTNSKTFVQTVTVALSKHSGFKRVDRGRYECIR